VREVALGLAVARFHPRAVGDLAVERGMVEFLVGHAAGHHSADAHFLDGGDDCILVRAVERALAHRGHTGAQELRRDQPYCLASLFGIK